ncbi:MAG TPA: MOSC N-terminal beta barrel domain-containing protein [Verrucomicrobiae bacterium]|nr:MOSC N-terminal beta barrel domain-containing protein [Verrucomicrobiae bacterium]
MHLARIEIFPIKSLDGVALHQARITSGGILENDRIYAIRDTEGRYVNGKRTARVHDLRSAFNSDFREVRLWQNGHAMPAQFSLDDTNPISAWLSDFFGFAVALHHEALSGFPDDREAFGPTVVSDASLAAIQNWYAGVAFESVRRRFRTNLELAADQPFAEDCLYGAPGERKPFQIGSVSFLGHNPCQRCVVPTRDPDTGKPVAEFQKTFMRLRKEQLPEWANRERFNHFYRFAVNTSIPTTEAGKLLNVGDLLAL